MFKYRSKCKWNLLLFINNAVEEICPNQEFLSSHEIDSKYLELILDPVVEKKSNKKQKEIIEDEPSTSS